MITLRLSKIWRPNRKIMSVAVAHEKNKLAIFLYLTPTSTNCNNILYWIYTRWGDGAVINTCTSCSNTTLRNIYRRSKELGKALFLLPTGVSSAPLEMLSLRQTPALPQVGDYHCPLACEAALMAELRPTAPGVPKPSPDPVLLNLNIVHSKCHGHRQESTAMVSITFSKMLRC